MILFTALTVSIHMSNELQSARDLSCVEWYDSSRLHVTSRYFGWCDERQTMQLRDLLEDCRSVAKTLIQVSGVALFGDRHSENAVLVALVAKIPELTSLAEIGDRAAQRVGLPPPDFDYNPHISLGCSALSRQRLQTWKRRHAALATAAFETNAIGLYAVEPERPINPYRLLANYALG